MINKTKPSNAGIMMPVRRSVVDKQFGDYWGVCAEAGLDAKGVLHCKREKL